MGVAVRDISVVVRCKKKVSEKQRQEMLSARASRRHDQIVQAVRDLAENATHEAVARRTGFAVGFLAFRYPDLRRLCEAHDGSDRES